MQLSTFSRYGMRAAVRLAYCQENGESPVSLRRIAEMEQISTKYLEAIFATLKKNTLIHSKHGKYGGYFLSKPPASITAFDIVEALDDGVAPVECIDDKNKCLWDPAKCSVINLWNELDQTIRNYLKSKSLLDIIDEGL